MDLGSGLFGLGWIIAVVICAVAAGKTDIRPHKIWICRAGISEEIWSDMLERYTYHEPFTRCGKCPGSPCGD